MLNFGFIISFLSLHCLSPLKRSNLKEWNNLLKCTKFCWNYSTTISVHLLFTTNFLLPYLQEQFDNLLMDNVNFGGWWFFFSFRPKKECSTGWLSKILVSLYIIYYLVFPLKVDFIWPQIAFSRDGSLCGSHYYSSLSAPFSARERNRVEFTSPIFPHESSCFICLVYWPKMYQPGNPHQKKI